MFIYRNYNIAIFTHSYEIDDAVKTIKQLELPDRVRIILYIPRASRDPKGVFPVNKLRNIAIVNCVTSHFLVMDMDMWPARRNMNVIIIIIIDSLLDNLYSELVKLPKRLRMQTNAAVIVPAFFLEKDTILQGCQSILSCAIA